MYNVVVVRLVRYNQHSNKWQPRLDPLESEERSQLSLGVVIDLVEMVVVAVLVSEWWDGGTIVG